MLPTRLTHQITKSQTETFKLLILSDLWSDFKMIHFEAAVLDLWEAGTIKGFGYT